jgi:hypothetical protein
MTTSASISHCCGTSLHLPHFITLTTPTAFARDKLGSSNKNLAKVSDLRKMSIETFLLESAQYVHPVSAVETCILWAFH